MSGVPKSKSKFLIPPEIQELFGEPPLLRHEDPNRYHNLLSQLVCSMEPKDAIEWLWVKDVADLGWEVLRLRRLKPLIVEYRRTIVEDDLMALVPSKPMTDEEFADVDDEEQIRKEEAETKHVDKLFGETHASLFLCQTITPYQAFDKLLASAELRRDRIFREIELRRERFAERLRKASHEVIDGHVDHVSLAPAD